MRFIAIISLFSLLININQRNVVNETTSYMRNIIGHSNNVKNVLYIPRIKLYGEFNLDDKRLKSITVADFGDRIEELDANIIMFAHSGNGPYSYFRNLDQLKLKDMIYVIYNNKTYNFIIFKKNIINPKSLQYLQHHNTKTLTLITCYKRKYRLLIIAKEKSPVN